MKRHLVGLTVASVIMAASASNVYAVGMYSAAGTGTAGTTGAASTTGTSGETGVGTTGTTGTSGTSGTTGVGTTNAPGVGTPGATGVTGTTDTTGVTGTTGTTGLGVSGANNAANNITGPATNYTAPATGVSGNRRAGYNRGMNTNYANPAGRTNAYGANNAYGAMNERTSSLSATNFNDIIGRYGITDQNGRTKIGTDTYVVQDGEDLWIVSGKFKAKLDTLIYSKDETIYTNSQDMQSSGEIVYNNYQAAVPILDNNDTLQLK